MSDLSRTDGAALQMGNMRTQQIRDYNQSVKDHNDNVANTIAGLKDQAQNNATIKGIQDTALNLWTGKDMPNKIKAYQDWRAGKTSTPKSPVDAPAPAAGDAPAAAPAGADAAADAPAAADAAAPAGADAAADAPAAADAAADAPAEVGAEAAPAAGPAGAIEEDAQTPDQTTTNAAADEPVDEGSPEGLGAVEEEASEGLGSRITSSLGSATGLGKEAIEEGLEKAGKGATVIGALGIGGMDAYNEYKSLSAGKGLSGDNWEEQSANVLQLGGAVSDIVGTFFPPAKLLGGILDISSGALDIAGQKVAESSKEADLTQEQSAETDTTMAAPAQQAAVSGRVS
tara:strand:- start:4978 stop:6006 length:1029 start_codon:yes stop_codon:yes gene_type:complete